MKFSVIIPCYLVPYNDCELTKFTGKAVSSLRKFSPDFELVLVDNGSTVGIDYLLDAADIYVRNKVNLGFAPAVNQGLKLATGNFLVVANNDIELIDDWLSTAERAFTEGTGVVSAHLHDHDPLHAAGRREVKYNEMFGALWMTTRSVIEDVGLLDEGYKWGMYEDRDYFYRVARRGYSLAKVGWVHHIGNATWGKLPNQKETFEANRKRFEQKWGV